MGITNLEFSTNNPFVLRKNLMYIYIYIYIPSYFHMLGNIKKELG